MTVSHFGPFGAPRVSPAACFGADLVGGAALVRESLGQCSCTAHRVCRPRAGGKDFDGHIDLSPERDAIAAVGRMIAAESQLLCFDEFQVCAPVHAALLSPPLGMAPQRV